MPCLDFTQGEIKPLKNKNVKEEHIESIPF